MVIYRNLNESGRSQRMSISGCVALVGHKYSLMKNRSSISSYRGSFYWCVLFDYRVDVICSKITISYSKNLALLIQCDLRQCIALLPPTLPVALCCQFSSRKCSKMSHEKKEILYKWVFPVTKVKQTWWWWRSSGKPLLQCWNVWVRFDYW